MRLSTCPWTMTDDEDFLLGRPEGRLAGGGGGLLRPRLRVRRRLWRHSPTRPSAAKRLTTSGFWAWTERRSRDDDRCPRLAARPCLVEREPASQPALGGNSNGADRSRREPTQARPEAARGEAERAERGRPREEASGRSDVGATTRERGSKDGSASRLSSSRKSLISGDSKAQPASGKGLSNTSSSLPKYTELS